MRVAILETASYETHRPVSLQPKPLNTGALDRLEALAGGSPLFAKPDPAPVAETARVGIDMRDDMERVVDHLIGEVAFCASEQRCVMPIDADASQSMTMANFRVLMQPSAVEVRGPRGGSLCTCTLRSYLLAFAGGATRLRARRPIMSRFRVRTSVSASGRLPAL